MDFLHAALTHVGTFEMLTSEFKNTAGEIVAEFSCNMKNLAKLLCNMLNIQKILM